MTQNPSPLALVIDDQADIRELLRLALKVAGWRVLEAINGRQALELARAHPLNLIVVDLMMPEMTGIEFCARLLDDLHLDDVPVLMISGINPGAKLVRDFEEMPLKRKRFLHKPFSAEEVLRAAEELMPKPQVTAAAPPRSTPVPVPVPTAPASASATAPAGYRILVIDDDPDICMILQIGLSFHYQVETASNGMEGLHALDRFMPDFVISDINMPVMNGLETAEAIRRHPVLCRVPIFFLTGETDAALPRKAFDVGGNLYLRKPTDSTQIHKYLTYFIKETGLMPRQHGTPAVGSAPAASRPPIRPPAPAAGPLRVLTVDADPDHQRLLRLLIEGGAPRVPGGPFETLWTEDPRSALGNLARWEPDLILYNPRHPGLDGVAFCQTLLLQGAASIPEVAFVGTRFFEVELGYSHDHFKREPIDLCLGEEMTVRKLGEALHAARTRQRSKRFSIEQIRSEENERLRELKISNDRQNLARESLRQRYASVQDFIDRQFKA